MNRPRLFLSTVSEELRTTRQAVAATVRTLGFDPVSQDDFPTGYGELRQWLRTQLDSCEGLIQLVGDGYGAEPPELDSEYGRVSYTQFEFLYARHQNKKTWVIVIGKDLPRDKSPDHLDRPRDAGHPDPASYQAERRALQQTYLARLTRENHLRHTANNKDQLEIIVLRLRDELSELRRQWEEWMQKDEAFKARTTASLAELAEAARLTTENSDLILPRSGYCVVGPLTLVANLKTPLQQGTPDAYPIGTAGAHFIFDVYNPNRVDFIVRAIEVEVISYQAIDIEVLLHGVGATGVTRRFHARVQPALKRYQATFLGKAQTEDYVKILPEETEVFDVEVSTLREGLYELRVHVVGSLAGNRFDFPIDYTKRSIVFFNGESNYRVERGADERGPIYMSYPDYIEEMSTYTPDLARYGVPHADA